MTEQQWFAWDDPRAFLQSLTYLPHDPTVRAFSERRLRLFAVACCRRVLDRCSDGRVGRTADAAERFADATTNPERRAIKEPRRIAFWDEVWRHTTEGRLAGAVAAKNGRSAATAASWHAGYLVGGASRRTEDERIAQGSLLRDVIGNPFRPVAFAPAWRTSTAVALAGQMYESRDFAAMPILADALQDAGCEDADLLAHCRDPDAPHTRGCWVVDLVLGKA